MPKVTDLKRAYGIADTTIHRWTREFADYMSSDANPPKGHIRSYTIEDACVIALVSEMRSSLAPYARIHAALADGERGEWPPSSRQIETELIFRTEETQIALVTSLTAELAHSQGQLSAILEERDRLLYDLDVERAARREAESRAVSAETRIVILHEQTNESEPADPEPSEPEGIGTLVTKVEQDTPEADEVDLPETDEEKIPDADEEGTLQIIEVEDVVTQQRVEEVLASGGYKPPGLLARLWKAWVDFVG